MTIGQNETLKSLDIVVIVYELESDELYSTTYLHGEPTDDEILDHVTTLAGSSPFVIHCITK
jgi:hypothetical protein